MCPYTESEQEIGRQRCAGKRVYYSWKEAERAALCLIDDLRAGKLPRTSKGYNILAYDCDYCPYWHIGHSTSHQVRRAVAPTGKEEWAFGWDLARRITMGWP